MSVAAGAGSSGKRSRLCSARLPTSSLPPHTLPADWLGEHQEVVRYDTCQRSKNEVVANLLLPLFRNDPQICEALRYLNVDAEDARSSLGEYLRHRYQSAPLGHKRFVAGVPGLFRLDRLLQTPLAAVASERVDAVAGARKKGIGSRSLAEPILLVAVYESYTARGNFIHPAGVWLGAQSANSRIT